MFKEKIKNHYLSPVFERNLIKRKKRMQLQYVRIFKNSTTGLLKKRERGGAKIFLEC